MRVWRKTRSPPVGPGTRRGALIGRERRGRSLRAPEVAPEGVVRRAGLTPGAGACCRGLGLEMGTRWVTLGRAAGLLMLLLRSFGLVEPSERSGNRVASRLLL